MNYLSLNLKFLRSIFLVFITSILLLKQASAQQEGAKLGKNWAIIEGKHTVVIDSNRVNYIVAPQFPNGLRVNNFHKMESYYQNDTEFIHAQISANKVFDLNKLQEDSHFFISKTEVSNKEYNEFVIDCIKHWMQTNQKDIASKYKWNSPEYIAAIQKWLSVNNDSTPILFNDNIKPAKNWGELQQRNLNWSKIKFKGQSI